MKRVFILLCLLGCGASEKERMLQTTYETINASRSALAWMDSEMERQAKETPTYAAQSMMDGYRQRRVFVVEAFMVAYAAVAAASFDDAQIPFAVEALKKLRDEIRRLRAGEGR